jgi:hypothetical protein
MQEGVFDAKCYGLYRLCYELVTKMLRYNELKINDVTNVTNFLLKSFYAGEIRVTKNCQKSPSNEHHLFFYTYVYKQRGLAVVTS